MPYSFTKIEKEKSQIIKSILTTLALFYFVTSWIILYILRFSHALFLLELKVIDTKDSQAYRELVHIFGLGETIIILIFALIVAFFHFSIATRDVVNKMLKVLRAKPIDLENEEHRVYQNILDELSVATGGETFQGYILPSMSVNAYAISDIEGRNVIGVTEGLLVKLKRSQIEAIVAHEAAHVLIGDALDTTLTTSLFALHREVQDSMTESINEGLVPFFSFSTFFAFGGLFVILTVIRPIEKILNMAINRQREFRADAMAVRLTRDPLSLAEGLYLAAHHWRGAGIPGAKMSAIFTVSPQFSKLEESQGLFADFFSTHPPIHERISILLDMAHTDFDTMVDSLVNSHRPYLNMYQKTNREGETRWLIRKEGHWEGPLSFDDIVELNWLHPETLVKRLGEITITAAYYDEELKKALEKKKSQLHSNTKLYCPHCFLSLDSHKHDDVEALKCRGCFGVLVDGKNIINLLNQHKKDYSQQIIHQAKLIRQEKSVHKAVYNRNVQTGNILTCPSCQSVTTKMERKFYNRKLHVEIDECPMCFRMRFDKNEIEILQHLFQTRNDNPG